MMLEKSAQSPVRIPSLVQPSDNETLHSMVELWSHELRTPLTALNICIEVLRSDLASLQPADTWSLLSQMQRSVSWLHGMVDNITAYARLRANRLALQHAPFRLLDCAEASVALIQPFLDRRGQQVRLVGIAPDLIVHGDRQWIEHVLVNLLMNANKFSEPLDVVDVQAEDAGVWTRICVTDHGPGIPNDEQLRIFGPYVRGTVKGERNLAGLGLGLHIVKLLVELHGGSVGVESSPGRGASFWFTLPRFRGAVSDETR